MGRNSETPSGPLPGTLYMLILQTLALGGPQHGYGIAQRVRTVSDEVLQIEEGALYPALQRMLAKGWVTATWELSDNNRRARFYRLTPEGREQLHAEVDDFERTVGAIVRIIRPRASEG